MTWLQMFVLTLTACTSGCVSSTFSQNIGVELEPLNEGWEHELRMDNSISNPEQFRIVERSVQVEVLSYAGRSALLLLSLNNLGDARVAIRSAAPESGSGRSAITAIQPILEWRPKSRSHAADPTGGWVVLDPGQTASIRLDGIEWLSAPKRGDRIEETLEFESEGITWRLPIAFRVASTYQARRWVRNTW